MFESSPAAARPRFRVDPWAADYGSSLFEEGEARAKPGVRPFVETSDWDRPVGAEVVARPEAIVFVDGVQRTEIWGFVEAGERTVRSALASIGVGAAVCASDGAYVDSWKIDRVFALAADCGAEPLTVPAGAQLLRFLPEWPASSAVTDAEDVLTGAQAIANAISKRRRALERHLAEEMAAEDRLVVLDGRLLFDPSRATPVVGLAKTIHEIYLEEPQRALVPRLGAGERTPVFAIDYETSTRYSWFLRLAPARPINHSLAGIVRLETPDVGRDEAVRLANLTAFHLPAFASKPEHDPRAPQNLLPVGGLERRLRHEMGDALFIRRAIEDHLMREAAT